MKHFLLFILALILFGGVAPVAFPRGSDAQADLPIEKRAALISGESADSTAVEVDGIRLEMLPYFVLPIPEKRPGASTDIMVWAVLANNRQTPFPLTLFDSLAPELIGSNSHPLQPQRKRDRQSRTGEDDCWLLQPKERMNFGMEASLSWENRKLQLKTSGLGYFWSFDNLAPSTYQLRLTYHSRCRVGRCYDSKTREVKTVEGSGTIQVATNCAKLHLVSHVLTDSSAVEADGIRFKTLLPEGILPIPENQPGANTSALIALRITNNTQTPLRFSGYDTLDAEIVGSDGKILELSAARNWTVPPTKVDFPLAQPGESVTFIRDAKLFWQNNQLRLGGADGYGGVWDVKDLAPGSYQVRLKYVNSKSTAYIYDRELRDPKTGNPETLEGIWTGAAITPFREIRLVQP